jgi:hypothetical protein
MNLVVLHDGTHAAEGGGLLRRETRKGTTHHAHLLIVTLAGTSYIKARHAVGSKVLSNLVKRDVKITAKQSREEQNPLNHRDLYGDRVKR